MGSWYSNPQVDGKQPGNIYDISSINSWKCLSIYSAIYIYIIDSRWGLEWGCNRPTLVLRGEYDGI